MKDICSPEAYFFWAYMSLGVGGGAIVGLLLGAWIGMLDCFRKIKP